MIKMVKFSGNTGDSHLQRDKPVTVTGVKRLEDGCETSWGGGGDETSMVRDVLEPCTPVPTGN